MATFPKFLPADDPPIDKATQRFVPAWLLYFQSLTTQAAAAGSVASVSATSPITSTGGTTPIIAHANSGVTPGSYTSTNLTVDAKGHITAAANGAGGGTVTNTGTLTANRLIKGNGGVDITVGDLTGDVTTAGTMATTIATNAVTDAKFRQSAALSVVGRSANSTGNVADIAAASDGQVLRRSGTAVGFGAVDLASANAVTGVLPEANGGSVLLKAVVSLTNAQVQALPTTPFTLVAAPGAGFAIVPDLVILEARFRDGAYTGAAADSSIQVDIPSGSTWSNYIANDSTSGLTYLDAFLSATDQRAVCREFQDINALALGFGPLVYPAGTTFENGAVQLTAANGAVDFGGGHADNVLRVTTIYTVVTIP